MNFIPCTSQCRYQFDGRCELAGTTSILSDNSDKCPFYKKRDAELLFPGKAYETVNEGLPQHPQYH